MPRIDHEQSNKELREALREAEIFIAEEKAPDAPAGLEEQFDKIFESKTQAIREALLGCVLAGIVDSAVDLRLPYMSQGAQAFNGRDLDERVINPLLKEKEIPSSNGPYLGVFRRQVRFDRQTRHGLRDKTAYDAFLEVLTSLEADTEPASRLAYLRYMLYRFLRLRERAEMSVIRIHRMSLTQLDQLVQFLLDTPSGGLLPMLITVAGLRTIKDSFSRDWNIDFRGVNVADMASGQGGDIILSSHEEILLAIEVTERAVDRARVVQTFRTKIAPKGIDDYLFLVHLNMIPQEVVDQANQYFAQGHDVNLIDIREWTHHVLVITGKSGRSTFNSHLHNLISRKDVSNHIKTAWNEAVQAITSI